MFDDLKSDNKPTASATPPPVQTSASADDMFGDVDPAPKLSPIVFGQDRPSAVQSGKIKPVSQTNAPQIKMPVVNPAPMVAPQDQLMMEEESLHGSRKFIIAGAVVLLILIAAGLVYFFVRRSANTNQEPVANDNVNTNINQVIDTNNTNDELVVTEADDDFDGLPNAEEIKIGTNPYEPDSDNDGVFDQDEAQIYKTNPLRDDSDQDNLGDYDEIFVWRTDPNKADTDDDGFSDGVEVKNGYNPLGRGLIEDAPPGTFNLEGNNQATSTNQNNNQ